MASIITELWYGNIEPGVYFGNDNHKMRQLERMTCNLHAELNKALDDSLHDKFERYCKFMDEYISVVQEQAFVEGFSIGTKLLAEAMVTAETAV